MSCCPNHTEQSDHHPHQNHQAHDHASMMANSEAATQFLRRFWVVTFLLIPLLLLTETASRLLGVEDFALRKYLQFGVATIIFYFSLVFFEHAKHEIIARQYGMMTLVSLAVGAGYLFSVASTFLPQLNAEFYIEISTLIWVLLFGHYLEAKSSSAAGDALQEVAKLLPKQAHLLVDGQTQEVELTELRPGNIVLVKPGEKVPADGVILRGKANTDESLITGESRPVEKNEGQAVVAGSICLDGSLTVKLTRVGETSTIGQIQKLIAQAQKTKPTAQKIADRASKYLTFTALGVAILTILVWSIVFGQPFVFAVTLAITVLVIACPHALGLAIPTVSTIATSQAVKNGVFVKDLGKLEVIKDIDYVIFDKTGTLTKGKFGVSDVIAINSKLTSERIEILRIAASLEQHSSHVIGQAIVRKAQEQGIKLAEVTDFKNIAGKGITGSIQNFNYAVGNLNLMQSLSMNVKFVEGEDRTIVYVASDKEVLGIITLADQIKQESFNAIENLHQMGVKVAMLTGDNEAVTKSVADELGIDTYFAEVLPEDKYKKVKGLQDQGSRVMMVGDGVNDAPALTQADVGVAIGAGTDVAVEAGDVVLMRNNPEDVIRLIVLAKKVYRKMVENLIWATGYNVIAIPAAAGLFAPFGFFLKPAIGALLMSLSSVIVVINALLLKSVKL